MAKLIILLLEVKYACVYGLKLLKHQCSYVFRSANGSSSGGMESRTLYVYEHIWMIHISWYRGRKKKYIQYWENLLQNKSIKVYTRFVHFGNTETEWLLVLKWNYINFDYMLFWIDLLYLSESDWSLIIELCIR